MEQVMIRIEQIEEGFLQAPYFQQLDYLFSVFHCFSVPNRSVCFSLFHLVSACFRLFHLMIGTPAFERKKLERITAPVISS